MPPPVSLSATAHAGDTRSTLERGRALTVMGGCHDCHTPGYPEAAGKVPQTEWLTGNAVGFQGPWGTSYPVNLRLRLRWIEHLVVTPRFHCWHHAVHPIDRNFAVHFPWIDRLFGTHYLPDGRWPDELGIEGHPVPPAFAAQLAWPFSYQRSSGA